LLAAIVLYAVHHALAKGALFLLLDVHQRSGSRWSLLWLALLAFSIAGAPLTSGAVAKGLYAAALVDAWQWLLPWLGVSALATTLLMMRMLFLAQKFRGPRAQGDPWALAIALMPAVAGLALVTAIGRDSLPGAMLGSPLAVIAGIATGMLIAVRRPRQLQRAVGMVPAGDLGVLAWHAVMRRLRGGRARQWFGSPGVSARLPQLHWGRDRPVAVVTWPIAGMLWLLLLASLLAMLLFRQ
jgi:hypothetical protein